MDYNKLGLDASLIDATKSIMEKKLHPNQEKLDKNKNGKLDADDFKKLRGESSCDDEEEDELDEATDVSSIKSKYKENEDNNNHSENAVLLAKHFGSKSDQNKATKAMAYRDKNNGYGADPEGRHYSKMSHEVHSKLYHHIKEELSSGEKGKLAASIRKKHDSHRDKEKEYENKGMDAHMRGDEGDGWNDDHIHTSKRHGNVANKLASKYKKVMGRGIDEELYLEDYTLEEIEDFMMSEDFEQLDELSKNTLGSYVKKASNSLSKASHDLGDKRAQSAEVDRFTNRHMGDKFRVQGKMKDDLGIGNKAQEKDLNTVLKRTRGITKAADKLTKEQVEEFMQTEAYEQLDELSKGTLKSYVGKAVQSHGSNRVIANMAWDKSKEPGDLLDTLGHRSLKDSKKRSIGIAKAVDKLTKEQYEEIEALAAKHGLGE